MRRGYDIVKMRLPTQLLLLAATTTAAPYADLTYGALRSEIIALAGSSRASCGSSRPRGPGDLANVVGALSASACGTVLVQWCASLPAHQSGADAPRGREPARESVELRRPTNSSSRAEVFLSGALHGDGEK